MEMIDCFVGLKGGWNVGPRPEMKYNVRAVVMVDIKRRSALAGDEDEMTEKLHWGFEE